jgi:hypothetical protein
MSKAVSPIERVIDEEEAEEVGGIVSQIFGEQGCRKTMALVNKAMIGFLNYRVVFWRGQDSCQWILLAANNLPVTLWMHEDYEEYSFKLTGSKSQGIDSREIDVEEADDIDVEIKSYSDMRDLEEKAETDRVNVYYIPNGDSPRSFTGEKEKYYYQRKHVEFFSALNNRDWMDHVSILNDENDNVFGDDTKGELYNVQEYQLPSEVEDFRKNRISHMGATHSYQSVHYKYHSVKCNDRVYMRRAKVHSEDTSIDQGAINKLDRGQFVVPGFDENSFDMPYLPHEKISWMPDKQEVKLRMDFKASIPDIRPEDDAEEILDELPVDTEDLRSLWTVENYAKEVDLDPSTVRRKLAAGKLPGMKLNGKWLMSEEELLNDSDVPL